MGLMQIMPRSGCRTSDPILGRNLKDDETNLRYGVYILKHFAQRTADTLDAGRRRRGSRCCGYNGCVRGTNTPDCRAYPEKVRRHVNENARTICAGRDFHECVRFRCGRRCAITTPPARAGPARTR